MHSTPQFSAPERLKALLRLPEASWSLPEAALLIAAQEYPDLQVGEYLARIATTADKLRRRLPADAARSHLLAMLNHMLFTELGYCGATHDYYDPRNSFLNDVMERRQGIPISLSILYLAIGERIGLPLAGVSFPGHFLVRCRVDGGIVVLDPFHRGASLSEDDLRARLATHAGEREAADNLSAHLQPATKAGILSRLLRNLKSIYVDRKQLEKALAVTNLMLIVAPDASQELLARALLYRELECVQAAQNDLERYALLEPESRNDSQFQSLLSELRERRTNLH